MSQFWVCVTIVNVWVFVAAYYYHYYYEDMYKYASHWYDLVALILIEPPHRRPVVVYVILPPWLVMPNTTNRTCQYDVSFWYVLCLVSSLVFYAVLTNYHLFVFEEVIGRMINLVRCDDTSMSYCYLSFWCVI